MMIRFEGIWFNADSEVKRDVVMARDSNEASAKIHALYPNGNYPGEALTVVSASGTIPPTTALNGGIFL